MEGRGPSVSITHWKHGPLSETRPVPCLLHHQAPVHFPFPVHLSSPCLPCPPGHLSEKQLLLCGLALAGFHFPRWLCLLIITLQGLLFHLHSSQLLGLLLPRDPVQVRLLQEGLVLTELLLCLLGVALRLPGWLAGFGDNLQEVKGEVRVTQGD